MLIRRFWMVSFVLSMRLVNLNLRRVQGATCCCCRINRTIFCARKVILILIGMPGDDLNEIGHKRGYQTLDNRRIAPNHVLLVHIGLVVLGNNCNVREWVKREWVCMSECVRSVYEMSCCAILTPKNTCSTLTTCSTEPVLRNDSLRVSGLSENN